MNTTIMRNSVIGDQWIREMYAANPPQRVMDERGVWNGNITFLARLAFTDSVFKASVGKNSETGQAKFSTGVLLPPMTDMRIFEEEKWRIYGTVFPEAWNPDTQQYYGLHYPFHDQAEKSNQYEGFTPGCMHMTVTSNYAPSVVDAQMNPITNPALVYPGVWAIVAVNVYSYNNRKKGIGFGLQSLCIVANDTNTGGGALDPKKAFSKASIVPPSTAPIAAVRGFGQSPPPGQAPNNGMTQLGYGAPTSPPTAPPQQYAVPPAAAAPPPPLAPASYQPPPAAPAYDAEAEELRRMMG